MSSDLRWRPATPTSSRLSVSLKFELRKKFGDPVDITLTPLSLSYLNGLLDRGFDDAKTLIDAVKRHDVITVKEFY